MTDTERRRTTPWHKDEFIVVDGVPCIYTMHRDGSEMRIHMPGGRTVTPPTLRAAGCRVEFPQRFRFAEDE